MTARRELNVLGPTIVRQDGVAPTLRPKERDFLAALAITHPRPTSMARIIAALWPHGSPTTARVAVRNHVARIRQTLGEDSVGTSPNGYQLGVGWSTDLDAFDADIRHARRALLNDDQVVARRFFERATRSVRGDAFADLPDSDEVVAERVRRQHLHLGIEDELLLVLIDADQLAVAIAEGSAMAAREPFRESRWTALALALYRSGQRRESVLCLQRGRDGIREIAGLEAGPALSRVELQILNDDPVLSSAHPADLVNRIEASGLLDIGRSEVFVGRTAILADVRRRWRVRSTTGPPARRRSSAPLESANPHWRNGSASKPRSMDGRSSLSNAKVGRLTCSNRSATSSARSSAAGS